MINNIQVPGFLTATIAIIVFFVGVGLNHAIAPLRRWNIPEAVTGGLLAAIVTLIAYRFLGVAITFDLGARDLLLLYFFTGIGLNARAQRSPYRRTSLSRSADPHGRLPDTAEPDRSRQCCRARSSERDHCATGFCLVDWRTRHHHRLGAPHPATFRIGERHGGRGSRGDAWVGNRQRRRRAGRGVSDLTSWAQRTDRRVAGGRTAGRSRCTRE